MGQVISCGAPGGRTLLTAGSQGLADNVREVLEVRPFLATYTFFGNNFNVMHHAAAHGHLEVLKAVVEVLQSSAAGVESCDGGDLKEPAINLISWSRFVKDCMNARTSQGKTPLMLACEGGSCDCVAYLLEQGADAFAVDKGHRRSAIHYAVAHQQVDVLKVLLSDSAKVHTEDGDVPLKHVRVHDMSGQCRYVDSRAENGLTALHMAAALGNLACVQALLRAGASMMVRTVDLDMTSYISCPAGSTPLHLAAQRGHIAILQAMLQAHADALGTWGGGVRAPDGQMARRGWEGDGRIDLRSVTNCLRQLPYHVAWQRGFRQAATILNPTIAIDVALETARDLEDGYGPQKLATLAAYALRRNLLDWLETFKIEKVCAAQMVLKIPERRESGGQENATSTAAARGAAPATAARVRRVSSSAPILEETVEQVVEQSQEPSPESSDQGGAHGSPSTADDSSPCGSSETVPWRQAGAAAAAPAVQEEGGSGTQEIAPGLPPLHRQSVQGKQDRQQAEGSPADSGNSATAKRVGFAPKEGPAGHTEAGPHGTSSMAVEDRRAVAVSPFQSISLEPFYPLDAEASASTSTGAAGQGEGSSNKSSSPDGSLVGVERRRSAPAVFARRSFRGNMERQRTMSQRMEDMERAMTVDTAVAVPPLQEADHKRDEGGIVPRALSAGLMRKSIRRTISTLRRRSELSHRLTGAHHSRAASIAGFEPDEDDDCGICLEADLDVAVNGCNHSLCVDCAIRLCEVTKKPPLCPFCRKYIEGFHGLSRTAA